MTTQTAAPSGTPPGQSITNPLAMGGGQLISAPAPAQQLVSGPQVVMAPAIPPVVRGVTPAADLKQLEAQRQQNLMTIKQLQQNLEAAQQKDLHLKVIFYNFFNATLSLD